MPVVFERQYPRWTAALFDQPLLTRQNVAGELAQLFTRYQQPDAAVIANAWAACFPDGVERAAELTPAVTDFLTHLEDALKDEEALQPLFDHRALERIASDFPAIRELLTAVLSKLEAALGRRVLTETWQRIQAAERPAGTGTPSGG